MEVLNKDVLNKDDKMKIIKKKLARRRLYKYQRIENRLIIIQDLLLEMKNDAEKELMDELENLEEDKELEKQTESCFFELTVKCPEYFPRYRIPVLNKDESVES